MKRCILLLIMVTFICTACFDQEFESLRESDVTLKILTDWKGIAERRYLDVFELYFPNVNVLFINDGYTEAKESGEWEQWFEQHQPDLIMLLSGKYGIIFKKYIEDQLVEPLESYILRDQYSLENMAPGALEWLRMQSPDNQLYALANEFYNEVIFYNTEHFDALNIPYPNTKLSWTELEHAWQLLKFMTGPELARYELKAMSEGTVGLPIWMSNIEQLHVENTAAFYDAMPSTRENPNYRPEIRPVQPLLQQYLDAVIAEEIGLDQALEELEEKITELLEQGALQ